MIKYRGGPIWRKKIQFEQDYFGKTLHKQQLYTSLLLLIGYRDHKNISLRHVTGEE